MIRPRRPSARVDDLGYERIMSEMMNFQKSAVEVGILASANRTRKGGATMAMIGAVQEYGSPKHNIPARSFIRSWLGLDASRIHRLIVYVVRAVSGGNITAEVALNRLGVFAQGGIKERILAIQSPPLRPATVRRKKSSKPLVDTGQLLNSIQFRVIMVGIGERIARTLRIG